MLHLHGSFLDDVISRAIGKSQLQQPIFPFYNLVFKYFQDYVKTDFLLSHKQLIYSFFLPLIQSKPLIQGREHF